MYNINPLGRPVLIMPSEVLFHAATDTTVDARQILQNIIVAEERIIAPALGDAFYEELIGMKNKVVTIDNRTDLLTKINIGLETPITLAEIPLGTIINAIEFLVENQPYIDLWNRFLWKLTAEAVDMMSIVPSWLRTTSQGQMMNNPNVIGGNGSNAATGTMKDVKFKLDVWLQDRIDPLIERMRLYICQRKAGYPRYSKPCEDCQPDHITGVQPDGISIIRKSDFVFNAYPDNDDHYGNRFRN